jgi:hypothetical protein
MDSPIEGHVSDLIDKALAEDVPFSEIVEEVGEVSQAIADAIKAGRHEIK